MLSGIPLFPEEASTLATKVDALYFFLVAVSAFFVVLIAGTILYFAIKYRRRSEDEHGASIHGAILLETVWTIIPLGIALVMFIWSADIYFQAYEPPKSNSAVNVYVLAKQWMWKFQHMDGQREINELHVPVNTEIKLIMTSQDVIHSFFVPDFRIKMDVLPGRYRTLWFQATKPGTYHLFCAEYCGAGHSRMVGQVIVMKPADYQAWIAGGVGTDTLAAAGQKVFTNLACVTCHSPDSGARGPMLSGLFDQKVRLQNGQTVVADDAYLRESIMDPGAQVVAGYQPIMPTYQGLVNEEQLLELIEYIKTLKPAPSAPTVTTPEPDGHAAAPKTPAMSSPAGAPAAHR
ncbi:MAG: cytochrome c oxidase subunit II [Acidobacteriota bacterium]|nr:cytochrome c oxidase subunit II [Acidobacteriota bacterium]